MGLHNAYNTENLTKNVSYFLGSKEKTSRI